MSVTNIKDNILVRLAAVLGSDYSKLSYMVNIKDNKFDKASKKYGVLPSSATQVSGVVNKVTMDHEFTLVVTDSFNYGTQSQINDAKKAERINELQDKVLDIYKDLAAQNGFLGPNVLLVNGLRIEQPEFLDEEKVIIQQFSINVKYRI